MPLICLSNVWRSLEMPLINCKVELKLKWARKCVLASAGNEIANANSDNPIYCQRHKIICSCSHFINK